MKYKKIKKSGVEGFSEKPSTPISLFAYKRKKGLKKAENLVQISLPAYLKKKPFKLKGLDVSFSTVLFIKAVGKIKNK